jgi:hypothetical protein
VRHLTGQSPTEYRRGLQGDPQGHGASLEPKGEGETSMPRKRLRTKTLCPRCCKTCEHGERVSLEPRSPVVQPQANRRASEEAPAPPLADHTRLTELGIAYGTRVLGERSHRSSLSWGKPGTWRRMTGLEASEKEGMRDAGNRPEWMPRSGKRYTLKGVRTVWGGADGKGLLTVVMATSHIRL